MGIAHKNIAVISDRFWNRRDFRRLFDAALRSHGLRGSGMRGGSLGRSCGGIRLGSLCGLGIHRALLDLRGAQLLDLVDALFFLVHADGDELDDRLGHAQAAFQFGHQAAIRFHGQQVVIALVELADGVGQLAVSQLLARYQLAIALGNGGFKAGDQLVGFFANHIRAQDKHHFVFPFHSSLVSGKAFRPCLSQPSGLLSLPFSRLLHSCSSALIRRFNRFIATLAPSVKSNSIAVETSSRTLSSTASSVFRNGVRT